MNMGTSSGAVMGSADATSGLPSASPSSLTPPTPATQPPPRELAPESQTVGAVAEEEWKTQGIAFKSRAELGAGLSGGESQQEVSGSAILAKLYQESLIFDQYDRAVQQQDDILQSKVDQIQQRVKDGQEKKDE